MNWIGLVGAVGFGAIVTKLLDALWLSRITRDNEQAKWFREQRLVAYKNLAQELLTMGLWNGATKRDDALSVVAQSILLANDDRLAHRIEAFFSSMLEVLETLEKMRREANEVQRQIKLGIDAQKVEEIKLEVQVIMARREEKMKAEYPRVREEAHAIIQELRVALQSN